MRKAESQRFASNHRVSGRDYYQILISVLMVILGLVILVRSLDDNVVVMPLLVGGGFLALGCYRLKYVVKFFRERRKCSRR